MKYKIILNILKIIILICLLFGMPIIGILLSGQPVDKFIEFPPTAEFVEHSQFSWGAFIFLSIFCLVIIMPIVIPLVRHVKLFQYKYSFKRNFPWWGIAGVISIIFFWIISWNDFHIFAKFKVFIFFFLWMSYIIIVNAMEIMIAGKCLLTHQTGRFLLLFPLSAFFWWYFEYINEFVQNWYYIGTYEYSEMEIFLLSTLSFSTVLPAVASTSNLMLYSKNIDDVFSKKWIIKNTHPKALAVMVLIISCAGLADVSIFPEHLYPLVWVSPFLILVSIQVLFNEQTILSGIAKGNWSLIISASLAALICGIFWEMWNFYSMPKWQYSIPFVHKFQIFEMPVLGFWGYFPFGLLCISVAEIAGIIFKKNN